MKEENFSKFFGYESNGKRYNGEKAIISLTSWKGRIDTVSKTLFSLIKMCPGFHIVLVLSKDEFPLKEKELPKELLLFEKTKLIEILWIKPNVKSFKKILFTMDKYRSVPIISADDDCIYEENFAQIFYNEWIKNKTCVISHVVINKYNFTWTNGQATLYPPYCFKNVGINNLKLFFKLGNNDDAFYSALFKKLGIECRMKKIKKRFHTDKNALSPNKDGTGYDAKKDISAFFGELK